MSDREAKLLAELEFTRGQRDGFETRVRRAEAAADAAAEAVAERNRLRAAVDAARAFVAAQEFPDQTADQDPEAWDRMIAALHALDESPDMGGEAEVSE